MLEMEVFATILCLCSSKDRILGNTYAGHAPYHLNYIPNPRALSLDLVDAYQSPALSHQLSLVIMTKNQPQRRC